MLSVIGIDIGWHWWLSCEKQRLFHVTLRFFHSQVAKSYSRSQQCCRWRHSMRATRSLRRESPEISSTSSRWGYAELCADLNAPKCPIQLEEPQSLSIKKGQSMQKLKRCGDPPKEQIVFVGCMVLHTSRGNLPQPFISKNESRKDHSLKSFESPYLQTPHPNPKTSWIRQNDYHRDVIHFVWSPTKGEGAKQQNGSKLFI